MAGIFGFSKSVESDSCDTLSQEAPTCLLHSVLLQTIGLDAQIETSGQCSCSSSCSSGESAATAHPKERLCTTNIYINIYIYMFAVCGCTRPSQVPVDLMLRPLLTPCPYLALCSIDFKPYPATHKLTPLQITSMTLNCMLSVWLSTAISNAGCIDIF